MPSKQSRGFNIGMVGQGRETHRHAGRIEVAWRCGSIMTIRELFKAPTLRPKALEDIDMIKKNN